MRYSTAVSEFVSSFFYRNLKRAYPTVASASGVFMYDTTGKRYLDGCSGAVVCNLGHGVKEINQAIEQQLAKVAYAHTSQFVSQPALDLADKLVSVAPPHWRRGARIYFTSGGSESVETAIKMARGYFVEHGEPDRHICLSRFHSYHGSTLGALALTGHPARRKPYLPLLGTPTHITSDYRYRCKCGYGPGPCPSEQCVRHRADELEEAILLHGPESVMAFIAEPIVGAALGAAVPGDSYWARVREICTKYGVLLIADEVMTGLGRTGAVFAMNHWDIEPDIITLGKGLSAGYMPLGAVLAAGNVVSAFERKSGAFEHGFTYSGHPAASAAGKACLEYMDRHGLVAKVAERERELFRHARELMLRYDFIGDVRGRGFLLGFELVSDRDTKEPFDPHLGVSQLIAREAFKEGLLVYPGSGFIDGVQGDHFMLAPPFTITDDEMDELFSLLDCTLASVVENLKVPQ
jgi:adenosylmethionine-8-amino-7-oxononanoate aminotransferase